ncbi:MAG: CubicO group peptidase (beta-lactamase class C family) [Myxococcota bacterium]|jgi:CubicO group peptidase (beta-lactamase class C family)
MAEPVTLAFMSHSNAAPFNITPLRAAAEREVENGLAACQFAVGFEGEIVAFESLGRATDQTRFCVASATKPIVASAIWLLMGRGQIDIERRVSEYLPEFAANGKRDITVEQVLLMTAGFPSGAMPCEVGADPKRRRAAMEAWPIEFPPGTQYAYHAGSAHWVLAALIEVIAGCDFRDYLANEVTTPLGLPRLLGLAREEQGDIAQLQEEGDEDAKASRRAMIETGVPGGGGVMTAATLASFYQATLHNPGALWDTDVLQDGTGNVRCTLPDLMMQLPANRTTAVVIGAGFGATWGKSPTAYGWPGIGGQIGFAEPANGTSFAFLQHGDADQLSTFKRASRMTNLALGLGGTSPKL